MSISIIFWGGRFCCTLEGAGWFPLLGETCVNMQGFDRGDRSVPEVDQYAVYRTPTAAGANLVLVRLLQHCKELVDGFGLGMKGVLKKKAVRSHKSVWRQDVQMVLWSISIMIEKYTLCCQLQMMYFHFPSADGRSHWNCFPRRRTCGAWRLWKGAQKSPSKWGQRTAVKCSPADFLWHLWTDLNSIWTLPVTSCVLWRSWRQWGEHMICPFWLESP